MPNTLSKMLREWFLECSKWDDFTKDKFVFGYYKPISPQTVQRRFDDAYNKAKEKDDGLPKIRIHDFDIAKRLGDTVETLHNTYAHWFDTKDKSIVDMMNKLL